MSKEQRQRASAGLLLFVAMCFLGSWAVAASLRVFGLSTCPAPIGTRLLTTSLLYALAMGWQPVVATWVVRRWVDPPDELDLGLRNTGGRFYALGCSAAVGVALAAASLAWLAASAGLGGSAPLHGSAEAPVVSGSTTLGGTFAVVVAFLGTLLLIWVQAFAEEVGWRGYFLPRSMERLGNWQGLVVQGAVWGLWYAPVLFFAGYGRLDTVHSLGRCAALVVSCGLIGTLLGWLRLGSRSVAPAMVANTTLTLAAGLPYVIHGVDAGLRSAVFGPAGWTVLLAVIGALLLSRWRAVVRVPTPCPKLGAASGQALGRMWVLLDRGRDDSAPRVLH